MSTRNRKVKIDQWWIKWISNKASLLPLKYETTDFNWFDFHTVEVLQALEVALLEHGVEAPFEINLPRKKSFKDE